jgi:hypothetical protein
MSGRNFAAKSFFDVLKKISPTGSDAVLRIEIVARILDAVFAMPGRQKWFGG